MKITNEVLVAIIGVIGVIVTAVLSNWSKIFPDRDKKITVKVSGYSSTGVFETELRYFFEVSGTRASIENMTFQLSQQFMIQLIQQYPDEAEEIKEKFQIIAKEAITVDDLIRKLLPVYKKYFTVEVIQELNRFYSTDTMQQMVRNNQALIIEAAPLQLELITENQERIDIMIKHKLEEKRQQLQA
jgi:hypothetical protein